MAFATSNYNNIDHPIDRSLLGTCAITLLFLIVSLALFGPFVAILIPTLIVASISRFIIKLLFCHSCQSGLNRINNEYYSPDKFLVAEETRWLNSNSKIIILMILDNGLDVLKLQSIISSRLILIRKDELLLNPDSAPSQTIRTPPVNERLRNFNELLYPKFSQKISLTKAGWKWKYDEKFNIENHIHNWKDSIPISILTNPEKLSEFISNVNTVPLNLDHPPWDAYLISMVNCSIKFNIYPQVNSKCYEDNNSNRSMLIFRVHPSLSDGVSLVHILCGALSDEQCPIDLKDRFHSSGKFLNSIRALFIGPVVFIQKWLLTRRDCNIFHPLKFHLKSTSNNSSAKASIDTFGRKESKQGNDYLKNNDQDHCSARTSINTEEGERLFHFCTYPLSIVSRIKCVTRSTFTEIFLAAIAGALRTYQQQVCKVQHPYDLLCLLPTDLTKEHHTSNPARNSSSVVSKISNQSSMTDYSQHITNNYSLVDFGLPTNTEGMIPRLWEVKQRMEELKNSADSIILFGLSRILKHLCPESVGRKIMKTYYNKNSLSISSLQGPDCNLTIGGQQIHSIVYWFPSFYDVSLSVSCFSYGDSFICSVAGDSSNLPRVELILDAVVYQLELLNKLLENRRIPGEHKSQRYAAKGNDEQKIALNIGKFDTNEKEMINKSLSPSISTDHLYIRLSSIQNQLQNDKELSDEDLDSLRSEFSNLMGILRRRKSCGIDSNGEMADFDEEIEEMASSQVGNRRPSLQGLIVLSTRRRSLATSLTRPLNTGNRSRSNSKAAIHSSNYLVSPSCSSSKRPSLRFPDDIESGIGSDHFNIKMENRFSKFDKNRTINETMVDPSDNPRSTTRNESSPLTVTSLSTSRTGAERGGPRRCREDRV